MKLFLKFSLPALLLAIGCQKNEIPQTMRGGMGSGSGVLVQAADGTQYSVECLRGKSTEIQTQGESAMGQCAVSSDTVTIERGKFFDTTYSWVYTPSTYYSPTYYVPPTQYAPTNTSGTTVTYSGDSTPSTTYWNPYNDYRFASNPFCNFVFGAGTNINCFYAFGYRDYYYTNYYAPACNECLWDNHPRRCRNRCLRNLGY